MTRTVVIVVMIIKSVKPVEEGIGWIRVYVLLVIRHRKKLLVKHLTLIEEK